GARAARPAETHRKERGQVEGEGAEHAEHAEPDREKQVQARRGGPARDEGEEQGGDALREVDAKEILASERRGGNAEQRADQSAQGEGIAAPRDELRLDRGKLEGRRQRLELLRQLRGDDGNERAAAPPRDERHERHREATERPATK